MKKPKDYPYIRAWGIFANSSNQEVFERIDQARMVNAPQDAVMIAKNSAYLLISDLPEGKTKKALTKIAKKFQ